MGFGALPPKREIIDEPQLPEPPIPADSIANPHDVIILKKALTQGDIDSIKAGKTRMSILGYITYSDAFWLFGDRTTGFCFTYTPLPTGASPFDTCQEPDYTYVN